MLHPVQEEIVSPFIEVASYTECDMQSKKCITYILWFEVSIPRFYISRQDMDVFSEAFETFFFKWGGLECPTEVILAIEEVANP